LATRKQQAAGAYRKEQTMTEQIASTLTGNVQTITMNRPEKKNALTTSMYAALAEAIAGAELNATVRVVVLTGTGDSFTSGNDVVDFLQNGASGGEDRPVALFLKAISSTTKPLIAAVNGLAVGVGVTMLLHCDLVYAAEAATFQLPFTNLGLVPEASSSMLLPQMIGYHRAAELMLLGERFDATKALELGLVNALFPANRLADMVQEKAAVLAAKPQSSILATKALLKREPESVPARMAAETVEFARLLESPEAKAIMRAFLDRRKAG
jgi:enoyl-CoA hydratase/carnithine racemase